MVNAQTFDSKDTFRKNRHDLQPVEQGGTIMTGKKKKILSLAMTLVMGVSLFACAPAKSGEETDPNAELTSALDSVINREDGKALAGLAVLAIKDGEIAYEKGFGYRYIDNENAENNLPFDTDTKMRIASVSKTFTAIGVMKLVEQGKIDLDADISKYLHFSLRNPNYPDTPITVRMLLSHTSSLRDGEIYSLPPQYSVAEFFQEGATYYENGAHFASRGQAPGEYFSYANINFGLLGTIIEAASQQRFDQYMSENVLKPMGITGSFNVSDFNEKEIGNLAVVYRKLYDADGNSVPGSAWIPQIDDYKGVPVKANTTMVSNPDSENSFEFYPLDDYVLGRNATHFSPQGGLRVSAEDLAKLALMFMNDGMSGDTQILSKESVDLMFTPQWTWNGNDAEGTNGDFEYGLFACWGLGIHIITNGEHYGGYGDTFLQGRPLSVSGHYGDAYGMFSLFMVDRAADQAFIYLSNGAECDLYAEPSYGAYSENWIWEEEIVTALYQYIFPEK